MYDKNHSINGNGGSILVVTLLLIFAVSVIGATLASISSMDLRISGNQRATTEALQVAEAGLNEVIHRLALRNPTNATIGAWTGNIAISDTPPYDPNWEARIYLTGPGQAPASAGSIISTGTLQDPNSDYLPYSQGSGTEGLLSAVHKWEDLNSDDIRDANEIVLYSPEMVPPENFTTGFPVEIVTVSGKEANATRTVQAEVTRRTLLARTLGALYLDDEIEIAGNPSICGYNHDMNTPVDTRPMACFAFHLGLGHLPGVTTTGDDVDITGAAAEVIGDPAPMDTSSTNPFYELYEVLGISQSELNQILANADHTSVTNPLNGITHIQGDATINSNVEGEGLCYIEGDLKANGGFHYRGLIYVEGDLLLTGNPWLLGSIIVEGDIDIVNSGVGNAQVLYSKDAIQQMIGQYMPMIVLSWREM